VTARAIGHIGLVGCSPPGAALCYQQILTAANERGQVLEVSVHAHAFVEYMRRIDAGNWDGVAELMLSSAQKLSAVGAELLIAPCNTIHAVFDQVADRSPLPWLHIAAAVARVARQNRYRRIGLLGTRAVMKGPIYRARLASAGIDCVTPDRRQRERIDGIIFSELVRGLATDASRRYFASVIEELAGAGCDAVGLCCTELPLIVDQEISPLPLLDSTRLLAATAIELCSSGTLQRQSA